MFNEHYENVENTFHANSTSSNLELRTLIKIEINEQIQK
uniref:Uncharacterized protein n=1 Tax=Panagrolaimus sp. ES5 TaxID=591445 RepID=A0AC34FK18_9BILA